MPKWGFVSMQKEPEVGVCPCWPVVHLAASQVRDHKDSYSVDRASLVGSDVEGDAVVVYPYPFPCLVPTYPCPAPPYPCLALAYPCSCPWARWVVSLTDRSEVYHHKDSADPAMEVFAIDVLVDLSSFVAVSDD